VFDKRKIQVPSDRELINRLQQGSLDALGALYDRHQNLVFRTALGITGDEQAAADLLQDVFLRLHRFAHHVDPTRPLEPWLYRTTTNLTYTWIKRRKRWLCPWEDIGEWLSGGKKHAPGVVAEIGEEWQHLRKAVSLLPLNQRTVVVLFYIDDLSLQEISEILDVPVGTIKSRLHYGRRAIKKYLETDEMQPGMVKYEYT
jgi:RNA polymerase sigma-70 factor (ECF subfamily)